MKVKCEIEETDLENDCGGVTPGVRAICGRCGHEAEAYGQGEGSVKRCLVTLRDECPKDEANFYVEA